MVIIRGSNLHPRNRKYHYLEFLMNGSPDTIRYEVTEEDSERLRSVLQEPLNEFNLYFCFTAKDDRNVVVSIRDIQMVNRLWESGVYLLRKKWRFPKIQVYFRGQSKSYEDDLEDSDWLQAVYNTETFEEPDEPFLSFINVEGDEIFFNIEQIVLLAFSQERRINQTAVRSLEGIADFGPREYGVLAAHIWQTAVEEYEEQDDAWYGHIDFIEADENAAYSYEFDIYGPYATRSEAIEAIQVDFEWLAEMITKVEDGQ